MRGRVHGRCLLVVAFLIMAGSAVAADGIRHKKLTRSGNGRLVSIYDYFRLVTAQVGGRVSFAFRRPWMRDIRVPASYRRGETVENVVARFCTFYNSFSYSFHGKVLNIVPRPGAPRKGVSGGAGLDSSFQAGKLHIFMALGKNMGNAFSDPAAGTILFDSDKFPPLVLQGEYGIMDSMGLGIVFRWWRFKNSAISAAYLDCIYIGVVYNFHFNFLGDTYLGVQLGGILTPNEPVYYQENAAIAEGLAYTFMAHGGVRFRIAEHWAFRAQFAFAFVPAPAALYMAPELGIEFLF